MAFLIGFLMGSGITAYLVWDFKKGINTYVFKNVTVRLSAQDLIDLEESERELLNLEKELNLLKKNDN